jgi:hypothetical protein
VEGRGGGHTAHHHLLWHDRCAGVGCVGDEGKG